MATEAVVQKIEDSVYERSRASRTETGEDADPTYETNVQSLGPREAFSEAERPRAERQLSLSDTSVLKAVSAVVTGVEEHSVVIACQLPKGQVDVRLAKGVVPPHLAVFGTPVSLSLEESDGFRRPVLVEREIEPRAPTPEEVEVDEWIES